MTTPAEITITQGSRTLRHQLSGEPLRIGRAPDNELSLMDDQLSWYHAVIWVEDGVVWVRDLCSTNGTYINEERLRDTGSASSEDTIRLGKRVIVRVEGAQVGKNTERFALEDLGRGVRHTLRPGTLHPDDAVLLGISLPGSLTLAPDGGLSLSIQGSIVPLALEEVFEVGDGQRLRVVAVKTLRVRTVGLNAEPFPYRLTIELNGSRGSEALLFDRTTFDQHRISSENRVYLLYVLARKAREDLDAGRRPEECGWCDDDDIAVGIWGRGSNAGGKLAVLAHRLRRELSEAGFDHRFIEKERKVMRVRLLDIELL